MITLFIVFSIIFFLMWVLGLKDFGYISIIKNLILVFSFFKIKFSYWRKYGLSNPTPLPIFGNMLTAIFFYDKKKEWELYDKYGPVFGSYGGIQPIFHTSDPKHIKQVLGQDDIFHSQGSFFFNDRYLKKSLVSFKMLLGNYLINNI